MRVASALSFFAGTLLAASVAHAAVTSITVNSQVVLRVASDGHTTYGCSDRLEPANGCIVEGTFQGVGHQDCSDDTSLSFIVNIAGLPDPTGTFQVWAGPGDCTQPGATHNVATPTCWPVIASPVPTDPMVLQVRAADLAAFIGAPSASLPQTYQAAATAQACKNPGANAESTVNVYFLWFPNGQDTPTVSASYAVKVKLGAPGACTNVTAASTSDTSLTLSWLPPPDPTLAGFDVFADPGNACGDASAIDPSHVATQVIGPSATQASLSGLLTQTSYETAVSAVDEFGNVGPLAASDCATPGNNLVKGSCACSAVGERSGGDGLFALGSLLFLGVWVVTRSVVRRGVAAARSNAGGPTCAPRVRGRSRCR